MAAMAAITPSGATPPPAAGKGGAADGPALVIAGIDDVRDTWVGAAAVKIATVLLSQLRRQKRRKGAPATTFSVIRGAPSSRATLRVRNPGELSLVVFKQLRDQCPVTCAGFNVVLQPPDWKDLGMLLDIYILPPPGEMEHHPLAALGILSGSGESDLETIPYLNRVKPRPPVIQRTIATLPRKLLTGLEVDDRALVKAMVVAIYNIRTAVGPIRFLFSCPPPPATAYTLFFEGVHEVDWPFVKFLMNKWSSITRLKLTLQPTVRKPLRPAAAKPASVAASLMVPCLTLTVLRASCAVQQVATLPAGSTSTRRTKRGRADRGGSSTAGLPPAGRQRRR